MHKTWTTTSKWSSDLCRYNHCHNASWHPYPNSHICAHCCYLMKLKGKYILRTKATQLLLSNMTAMTESCTTVRDLWWWCTRRRVKRIRRRWNESSRWCCAVAGTAANLQKCLHTYMNSIHLQSIESNGRVIVKDWNVIRMMTMVMAYVALARIAQMPGASSTSSTPRPSSTIRWSATHTRAPE